MFNGGCAACNKYDGVRHESVGKRNRKNNGDGGKHRNGRDNGEADKPRLHLMNLLKFKKNLNIMKHQKRK